MMDEISTGRPVGIIGTTTAVALGLLPKLTCPICWPAYSVALGMLGLEFVDYTPYLLPLSAFFVAVSVAALAWTARARKSPWPLVLGVVAGGALLFGRFWMGSETVTYGAIALLLLAPFLPFRRGNGTSCKRCIPVDSEEIKA